MSLIIITIMLTEPLAGNRVQCFLMYDWVLLSTSRSDHPSHPFSAVLRTGGMPIEHHTAIASSVPITIVRLSTLFAYLFFGYRFIYDRNFAIVANYRVD